jgi:hypothetical protein
MRPEHAGEHRIYAVAGGNHVTLELARGQTGGSLDVIEVLAQPGGVRPRTAMPSASGSSCARAS